MSNIILPDDPDFDKPVIMGNPFEVDHTRDLDRQGITPGTIQAELERQRPTGGVKYASTLASLAPEMWHHEMMKTSQVSGVSNMMTQPMWFSPLHTPQNWQTASKRREVYQWSRFFYENEPKVAAAIDFYCFSPEMQVLMADGTQKSISSVQVGEKVRSHTGKANPIVKKFIRHTDSEEIIKITYSGVTTEKLKVTPGHNLLTTRAGKVKYVQAHELSVGDCLLTPCGYEAEGEFEKLPCGDKNGKYIHRYIIKIEKSFYSGDLYDLEVENDHSYVVNRIACSNSRFPMNGFKLECPNPKILKYFSHHIVKKLKLNERFKEISSEYFMIGDVFIHTDIKCEICGGIGEDPDTGEKCDHPGGTLSRIFIMNPDWIEVQRSPLTDEPLIVLVPDEELQQIVHKKQPKAIYDRIPDHLKLLILSRAPIPLSNRTISHLKHMSVPYGTYGTSIIRRLFTTLAYKTKIMTANWIVAERLILPVRVVKIGSDNRPASTEDIADVQAQLANVANDPNMTIITHHNFEYDWYGCIVDDDDSNKSGTRSYRQGVYVITDQGPKKFSELDVYTKIANVYTNGELSYDSYLKKVHFDYNKKNSSGKIYEIGNQYWTLKTTPNHRHYLSNGEIKRSDELKKGDELFLPSQWSWIGSIPESLPYQECNSLSHLSLEEFCRFIGYFVSEGDTTFDKNASVKNNEDKIRSCKLSQSVDSPYYQDMKEICEKIKPTMWIGKDKRREVECHYFNMSDCKLAQYLAKECGTLAKNKHIPLWMLQLPQKYLVVLLNALIDGDGRRYKTKISYCTISEKLENQMCELFTKLGYSPYITKEIVDQPNCNDIYRIRCSNLSSPKKFRIQSIETKDYNGKMWCLEMDSGNFFILVDGHLILTGNTQGKILQVTQEMEHIDKELLDGLMLNQALLNGEMCHSEDTEVLTENGFKKYDEVADKQIMCFDATSSCIRFESPHALHVYDFDGEMICFENKRMDIKVTPNHRMLISKDKQEWSIIDAKNVNPSTYFRGIPSGFESSVRYPVITIDDKLVVEVGDSLLELGNFVKLAGYYLSEGSISNKKGSRNLRVYQSKKKQPSYANIATTFENLEYKTHTYNYRNDEYQFVVSSKELVEFMLEHFGHGANIKSIPSWIKNLPTKYSEILIKSMCEGDGHKINTNCDSCLYSSTSEQMIDDLQEIAFRCGYSTRKYNDGPQGWGTLDLFRLHLSKGEGSNGSYPFVKKQHINKVPYKGKVWCFTTSTGFFVTRRNGKITIQGNSGYQSAQVGVETLIRRIESWRQTLAEWAEDRIFKPIAEMQGFVDEKESEEVGETVFLYPTIKWNELELKDKTQFHQLLNQLHDKQVISTQTLLEEFGFDYDQEVMRMRYEQAQAGPAGAMMPGMGGGAGGMPMGGGGGMPGGAASPAGGMPGMGMDPMGGGMGGGMDMGGGMGGGMPAAAEGGGKVTKRGKSKTSEAEEEAMPMVPIKLTKIEQKMASMLEEVATTMGFSSGNIRMQYPFANPKGGKPFTMDFALPVLKIDIETDGEIWHRANPEQIMHDKDRDYLLAQRGWTVLRFDDKVIEEAPHQVKATINSYLRKAMESPKKTASQDNDIHLPRMIGYFICEGGELKDLQGNAVKYYKTISSRMSPQIHSSEGFGNRSAEEYFASARKI